MRTILKAENLEKTYRVGHLDVPALRGVSLDVEEGEFVAIMGPSGCGKSTMLHLLGGLLTPTAGRIIIDGEDLTAATDAQRTDIRRRKIASSFSASNLFPTLTPPTQSPPRRRINSGSNGAGDAAAGATCCACGSKAKCTTSRWKLSGGEQSGVALARAVVDPPRDHSRPTSRPKSGTRKSASSLHFSGNELPLQPDHHHDHAQPGTAAMCRRIIQMRDGESVALNPAVHI